MAASPNRCLNCSAELTGEYCAACGQKRIPPDELSFRQFGTHLVDEVGAVRGRFKTVRSLAALLVPGFLTTEFLAGHRQRYLDPVKVYFLCAAIFFLTAPLAGFDLASLIRRDDSGELERLVSGRMGERGLDRARFVTRFDVRLKAIYTFSVFLNVAGTAGLLWILYRGRRRPWGAYVVFALHFAAFLYLDSMLAGLLAQNARLPVWVASFIGLGFIVLYLVLALRRAYPGRVLPLILKATAVLALTVTLNYFVDQLAIRLTLRMV